MPPHQEPPVHVDRALEPDRPNPGNRPATPPGQARRPGPQPIPATPPPQAQRPEDRGGTEDRDAPHGHDNRDKNKNKK
jgi:hypothetical protein